MNTGVIRWWVKSMTICPFHITWYLENCHYRVLHVLSNISLNYHAFGCIFHESNENMENSILFNQQKIYQLQKLLHFLGPDPKLSQVSYKLVACKNKFKMVSVPLPASLSQDFWEYWSPQPLRCNVFRKISLHWLRMCWVFCRGQSQTWINLSMGNIAGSFQPHKYGNPVDCKGAVFFNPWRKKKGSQNFGLFWGKQLWAGIPH